MNKIYTFCNNLLEVDNYLMLLSIIIRNELKFEMKDTIFYLSEVICTLNFIHCLINSKRYCLSRSQAIKYNYWK